MEEVNVVDGSLEINNLGDSLFDSFCVLQPKMVELKTKRPYILNPSNIECVVGEWNKDKGEYGVRVYFVSGNNHWFGGAVARDLLDKLFSKTLDVFREGDIASLEKKFDERVKAGPPSV